MADKPEETTPPKPHFLTTLPGILTGLGGVLVAATGLMTVVYQMWPPANANTAPPANKGVMLSSVPTAAENDRYKLLPGTWELTETRPKSKGGATVKWILNATVSDNVLRMSGKMTAVNGKTVSPKDTDVRAVFETNLADATIRGFFETKKNGVRTGFFPASLVEVSSEPPITIHANINLPNNEFCGLMGQKVQ